MSSKRHVETDIDERRVRARKDDGNEPEPEPSKGKEGVEHTKRDNVLLLSRRASDLDDGGNKDGYLFGKYRRLVVLGDSYSSDTERNWIGFLQQKACGRMSVANFAVGGDTVEEDLPGQIRRLLGKFPTVEAFGDNVDQVVVVIWLGINDCGQTVADVLHPIVEQIFDAMHDLYVKWKARAFMLIDVPPMHRSPGGVDIDMDDERYTVWNTELVSQAEEFANSTSKASIYVVSSYRLISDLLDDPESYGLRDCVEGEGDSGTEGSIEDIEGEELWPMWEDDIHLSKDGHRVFADRLWQIVREP